MLSVLFANYIYQNDSIRCIILPQGPEINRGSDDISIKDSKLSIEHFIEEVGNLIEQLKAYQITEVISYICKALKRIVAQNQDHFEQCNNPID